MSDSKTKPIESVSNTELYDRWAQVYDTDGNILQALDDLCLPPLMTKAFESLQEPPNKARINVIDNNHRLGAGTGRNTLKLLHDPFMSRIQRITALDLSPAMLEIAQSQCNNKLARTSTLTPDLSFHTYDALNPIPDFNCTADLLISTLVLEHLPLRVFFQTIRDLISPNGAMVVLTNMHDEMGRISQAGFKDATGKKIQGVSFVYELDKVLDVAKDFGGEIIMARERGVTEEDLASGIVGERGGKWVGVKCWFGAVLWFGEKQ